MLEELIEKLIKEEAIRFKIKVIPKSNKNEIVGKLGEDILKIKIAAVATKNKANKEIVSFLSTIFQVPKANIIIINGVTSPIKLIEISKK